MITIPKWVATASKDEVVAMTVKLAAALNDLSLDASETNECCKTRCPECRSDFKSCEILRADAVLIEWHDGPGSNE